MTKEELENNLGIIAKSGSLAFKKDNEIERWSSILLVNLALASILLLWWLIVVTVISKALGSDVAYKWESNGADGYTIEPYEKE